MSNHRKLSSGKKVAHKVSRKRPRKPFNIDNSLGDQLFEPHDLLQEFNNRGAVAIPVQQKSVETFLMQLNSGANTWFNSHLSEALNTTKATASKNYTASMRKEPKNKNESTNRDKLNDKRITWDHGQAAWDELSVYNKILVLERLDLTTESGRNKVFNKTCSNKKEPYYKYLCDRIRFALNGSQPMNMGTLVVKSWSSSGFGIWAHVHPGFGLLLLPLVALQIERMFNIRLFASNLPHVIYKPPGGSYLPCHNDSFPPPKLRDLCYKNILKHRSNVNINWVKDHGIQLLIHLQGSVTEGNTFTIDHQTPYRIAVILEAIDHHNTHPDLVFSTEMTPKKYWNKREGPFFFQVENNLEVLNRLVEGFERLQTLDDEEETDTEEGIEYQPQLSHRSVVIASTYRGTAFNNFTSDDMKWIRRLQKHHPTRYAALTDPEPLEHPSKPMIQSPIRRRDGKSGFVAAWPNGFFHGSYDNPTEARVSLTVPLTPNAPTNFRFVKRIKNIHKLIHGTFAEQTAVMTWLEDDKKPYCDGATHTNIAHELELVQGPFRDLAPNAAELAAFVNFVYNRNVQ